MNQARSNICEPVSFRFHKQKMRILTRPDFCPPPLDRMALIMKRQILSYFALAGLLLGACGFSEADVQATVAIAQSNAVQTVYAQFTEIALLTPSPTNTLQPTPTLFATTTPFATPTTGLSGGATGGCDAMTFVSDVTVSDGEEIAAGTPFTKTWQVKNTGSCDWSTAYQLMFSSGDQMGGPSSQNLSAAIAVGATGEVSVELVAPSTSGDYTGYWAIANAAGQAFGYISVVITVP